MLLTSIDPFVQEVERQFDRLARSAFTGSEGGRGVMPLDGVRRKDEVLLRFDLPGVDPDGIEITIDRGVLSVTAGREEELGEDDRVFVRERLMGQFTRRVYLPEHLDSERIEADYANGVLTLRIPVVEKAKPRKVEVRGASEHKAIKA
ncbi:Hsp20/alpha crystallin family protein [Microbispora sp. NPDC049125]|uniref:Hsp20/alpha crystallin family protein n=1 Tax=Microbispora sp. NPDC049125 TaxID=3154929 RepID=UPI003466FC13